MDTPRDWRKEIILKVRDMLRHDLEHQADTKKLADDIRQVIKPMEIEKKLIDAISKGDVKDNLEHLR